MTNLTIKGGKKMPIVLAPKDVELKVIKVLLDEKTKKHLESLGITINSKITVISSNNGNVIIKIKDGRLALNRDVASKILVA